ASTTLVPPLAAWRSPPPSRKRQDGGAPVLGLSPGGLGDALERSRREVFVALDSQVAERQDADQPLVAIEDNEPANLIVLHEAGRSLDSLVVEAGHDVGRHPLGNAGAARVARSRRGAYGDVAIGDHADELIVLPTDGQRPDVELPHPLGRSRNGVCRLGTFDP